MLTGKRYVNQYFIAIISSVLYSIKTTAILIPQLNETKRWYRSRHLILLNILLASLFRAKIIKTEIGQKCQGTVYFLHYF